MNYPEIQGNDFQLYKHAWNCAKGKLTVGVELKTFSEIEKHRQNLKIILQLTLNTILLKFFHK